MSEQSNDQGAAAKKQAAKKQAQQKTPSEKTIKVKAATNLCEGGATYKKGEEFETTPARAKALGERVT